MGTQGTELCVPRKTHSSVPCVRRDETEHTEPSPVLPAALRETAASAFPRWGKDFCASAAMGEGKNFSETPETFSPCRTLYRQAKRKSAPRDRTQRTAPCASSLDYNDDIFSENDLNCWTNYLVTPKVTVRKYTPLDFEDIVIYTDVPYDHNHPDRR